MKCTVRRRAYALCAGEVNVPVCLGAGRAEAQTAKLKAAEDKRAEVDATKQFLAGVNRFI